MGPAVLNVAVVWVMPKSPWTKGVKRVWLAREFKDGRGRTKNIARGDTTDGFAAAVSWASAGPQSRQGIYLIELRCRNSCERLGD
jgi:hypothetical protein